MRAKKSLGQNFLQDEGVINRIVAALDLSGGDTVIEIGPGRGSLTEKLIETGANVLAIEIDRELVPVLRNQFYFQKNFRIVEADVLETDLSSYLSGVEAQKTKLVGNLPYYISTAILQKLIIDRAFFSKIVFMLQREVAQRITAAPGNSDRGFLTVLAQAAFTVKREFDVPPTAFTPAPKVWSSVVSLEPKPLSAGDEKGFRDLVSAAFAQKRKTILNNLKHYHANAGGILNGASIEHLRRAETLTFDEWFALYDGIKKAGRPSEHPAK